MSSAPVPAEEIASLAEKVGASGPEPFVELLPAGTVRTFRVGDVVVRFDMAEAGQGLAAEATALRTLATAVEPSLTPRLLQAGRLPLGGVERPWLAYGWVDGPTLTREEARSRPEDLGEVAASLHGARVFDLLFRFQRQRPMTLMDAFKATTDRLRAWMLAREGDGLSQDLLTLTLSDLQRAMRGYAVAQDHHFRSARRRVLLHGRLRPETVVAPTGGAPSLMLVNFDDGCLGDAAEDLASLALAAELDDDQESRLLDAYRRRLEQLGRPDPRLVLRYFPRKFLLQLAEPVELLTRMVRIKSGEEPVLDDPVVALEAMMERTYERLVVTMNGLRTFVGGSRPVSLLEVKAMGRLVAFEELLLSGRTFRIAITGLPYAGKTEVGATLARRLAHPYLNTSVVGRALAWLKKADEDDGVPPRTGHDQVRRLFDRGLRLVPHHEPPFYSVFLDGRDVTSALREDEVRVAGAALLDDEEVRRALRDELGRRYASDGMIIEGAYAHDLIPGRGRLFHLTSSRAIRRGRLMSHRHDVVDEDEADRLLSSIDAGALPPPDEAVLLDAGDRPAGAAALEVLWHLLPPGRRPDPDVHRLGGRSPLYS